MEYSGYGTNGVRVNGKEMPWLLREEECDNLRRNSPASTKLVFTNLVTRRSIRTSGVAEVAR